MVVFGASPKGKWKNCQGFKAVIFLTYSIRFGLGLEKYGISNVHVIILS